MNNQFQTDGFSHIKQAFNSEEIKELITAADSANKNDLLAIDESGHTHKVLYPLGKHELFLKSLVHPSILEVLLKTIDNPLE